jgi:hypothetical protein
VGECRRTAFFFATLSAVNKSGARQFLSIVKKGCQSSKDILCLKSVLLVHLVVLFSSCVPLHLVGKHIVLGGYQHTLNPIFTSVEPLLERRIVGSVTTKTYERDVDGVHIIWRGNTGCMGLRAS